MLKAMEGAMQRAKNESIVSRPTTKPNDNKVNQRQNAPLRANGVSNQSGTIRRRNLSCTASLFPWLRAFGEFFTPSRFNDSRSQIYVRDLLIVIPTIQYGGYFRLTSLMNKASGYMDNRLQPRDPRPRSTKNDDILRTFWFVSQ
jgi:hypothetical protein